MGFRKINTDAKNGALAIPFQGGRPKHLSISSGFIEESTEVEQADCHENSTAIRQAITR